MEIKSLFCELLRPGRALTASGLLGTALLGTMVAGSSARSEAALPRDAAERAQNAFARMPLAFEANQGQTDARVRFLARGAGYGVYLTPAESVITLHSPKPAAPGAVLRMRLAGANPRAKVSGEAPLPGRVNYLRGSDRRKWHRNIPTFGQVRYDEVYPGIDVVYYGNQQRLEYDFVVAPGSDPGRIRLNVEGARQLRVDRTGDLLLETAGGTVRQHRPVVYQLIDGERHLVPGKYVVTQNQVRFALGKYDESRSLVIDPILSYSSFFGGFSEDRAYAVSLDANGGAVIAGRTNSQDYPIANPYDEFGGGGGSDAFVARFNTSGTSLVYSTYFGGSGDDAITDVAVDGSGNAYLAGWTSSEDLGGVVEDFDQPATGPQSTYGGGQRDAFLVKLNPAGSATLFGTYLGGSDSEGAVSVSVAVDSTGAAVLAGDTRSDNFPTLNAQQATFGGGVSDAFVAKLAPAGNAWVFSTYQGGSSEEGAASVAIGPNNEIYVAGGTTSANFPVSGSLRSYAGDTDSFVSRYNQAGGLLFSTFLGGTNDDAASGIAVDSSGGIFITGSTNSTDFPSVGAASSLNGPQDAFVVKLTGAGLVYSNLLGGSGVDIGYGIAVDTAGAAYVVGSTTSANFPVKNPSQRNYGGGLSDAFLTKLTAAGALAYSTYYGGEDADAAYSVAVRGTTVATVTGETSSRNLTVVNPVQPLLNRDSDQTGPDAFLARFTSSGTSTPAIPTGLTGTAITNTRIDLAWTDNSTDEDGFEIQRKVANGAFEFLGSTPRNTTTFQDSTVAAGVTYTYRVRSINDFDASAYSNEFTLVAVVGNLPLAPTNLMASVISATRVDLQWVDQSSNEDRFEIERKTDVDGTYAVIGSTTGPNITTFSDTTAQAGQTYYYRVRARNATGTSGYTLEVSATTPVVAPPATPGNLTATAPASNRVNLSWTDNSNNETSFRIERKTGAAGTYAEIASVGAGVTTYVDNSVSATTQYFYRVRANGEGGFSDFSDAVSVTTPAPAPPAAPSNLAATLMDETQINLTWTDSSSDETGFRVFRKAGSGAFTQVGGDLPAGTTSFSSTGLSANVEYTYQVVAFNAFGSSAPSNAVSAKTPNGKLTVPKSLAFPAARSNQLVSKPLVIKNASRTERLRVTVNAPSLPFSASGLPQTFILNPGASQSIPITVQIAVSGTKAQKFSGTLQLTSSDPKKRSATVKLSVTVKP